MGLDPALITSLGLGIMSSGKYGGNLGDGLMAGLQNYYVNKNNAFLLQRQQAMLNAANNAYGSSGTAPQAAPPMPAPGQAAPAQGVPPWMPGAIGGPTLANVPPAVGGPTLANVPPSPLLNTPQVPQSSLNLNAAQRLYALGGPNLITADEEKRKATIERLKDQYAPAIAKIDTLIKSDKPTQYLNSDPDFKAAWPVLAQRLGMDPVKDLNDQSIRTAFTFRRNEISSPLGLPSEAPVVPEEDIPGPLGSLYQRSPVTRKVTQVKAEEPLHQVIGPDGKTPIYVPASKASGAQAFNASLAYDPNSVEQTAAAIANYQLAPLTGFAIKTPFGQAVLSRVMQINPQYQAQQFAASQRGLSQFTSGKQGDTVRSLSVATSHLGTLDEMVNALDNKNVRLFNTIGNRWQQETGSPAPTNFDTVKNIVADEVTKAVIGYGGSQADREKAAAVIDRANSPAQLRGAIATYKQLMGGQLEGLRRQYKAATLRDDFDTLLSPAAQQQLGGGAGGQHPPEISALLDKYK